MIKYCFCLIGVISIVFMCSCKHEKKSTVIPTPVDSPIVYENFTELKPGNYWIYQDYLIDSVNGGATHPQGTYDSDYVEKDTVINGNTYHKFMDVAFLSGPNSYNVYLLRDSLSYTVNSAGKILFCSTSPTAVFNTYLYANPLAGVVDTITVSEQMGFADSMVTVDAGTFKTNTYRKIYYLPLPHYFFGPTREYDRTYAKGVGLIKETTGWFIMDPQIWERRLVRYHIQ